MPISDPTATLSALSRILVVDDDVGTVRLLIAILDGLGEVFFAIDGKSALSMVREHRPDLILLDAEMPGMSGFAFCKEIKADPIYADLPIIFITAHTDVEMETKALSIGAVDFINKPPSPAIVRARVKSHLALKRRTDELRRLASIDGLTGVANRRAFDAALDLEWRRSCRSKASLSLLMVDVDYFKRFNDCYGHQAGDDCLRTVASTLVATSRRPGELVARYGGEEFAVILPSCTKEMAMKFAEKLRVSIEALEIPHATSEASPNVTISIGISSLILECVFVGSTHSSWSGQCSAADICRGEVRELIAVADKALYEAKHGGRNRVATVS